MIRQGDTEGARRSGAALSSPPAPPSDDARPASFACTACGRRVAAYDSGFYAYGEEAQRGLCLNCALVAAAPEAERAGLRRLLGGVPAVGYWMHETSGVLAPAVKAYLAGGAMTAGQIAAMRAYLRQWMRGPWWGEDIDALRAGLDGLTSRAAIAAWLHRALDAGIDPL